MLIARCVWTVAAFVGGSGGGGGGGRCRARLLSRRSRGSGPRCFSPTATTRCSGILAPFGRATPPAVRVQNKTIPRKSRRPSCLSLLIVATSTASTTQAVTSAIVPRFAPFPEMATYTSGGKTESSKTTVLSSLPKDPTFNYLEEITDGFSEERKISDGGFGTLYRGITKEEEIIAVMKLEQNAPVLKRGKQFTELVESIMALKHNNIVQLIRFCQEGGMRTVKINGDYIDAYIVENLLCYEYVPKGSLGKYIFGGEGSIDWDKRFTIIKGICEGLRYLHGIPDPILHMDLKPENIFLDEYMAPKIANFALSRIFGRDKTQRITNNVVGSYGYIAPEYKYSGTISTQSDIYSLGMVIIETTTGEKNIYDMKDPSARKFVDKVRESWTEEHIISVYSKLDSNGLQEVKACIKIGLECVEIERKRRPPIEKIVLRLNGQC